MKYTVITTFNQAGLDTYGQRMIDSFEQFWPHDIDLIVCTENCQPRISGSNVRAIDLLANSPSLREFIQRHEPSVERPVFVVDCWTWQLR